MTAARVAADVGGTFTDVVVVTDAGAVTALKVPSTPDGFEAGVLQGVAEALGRAGVAPADLTQALHATTAGTNAILERSGPATALVTTRGFRDVLEIGRLRTPTIYDLSWRKPVPLVPRRRRFEITERTGADGEELVPVDVDEAGAQVEAAVRDGTVSVAVSLLNAHVAPAHERVVAAYLRRRWPEVFVTAGTEVVREIGEYERTSTAVCNAYLRPVMSSYLERLGKGLRDLGATPTVLVMQSGGGMMPLGAAAELPVHLCESGPAAGVLAAARVAEAAGERRAISFDMGGTTAKAALIEDFAPMRSPELSVGTELSAASQLLRGAGYTVRLPVIDLAEVGAGGGSLARVDAGGALAVGPASAGAEPGPACYAKGGTAATVTDANLLLGYVSPRHLAAGGVGADAGLARAAIEHDVAGPLGLDVEDAALAIHRVADQQMARALRAVSTERGRTVPDYTLVAFGGGGGLHAASLAAAVGIRRVVVPPLAGVLSTVGLLWAPLELSTTESIGRVLDGPAAAAVDEVLRRLAAEQRDLLDAAVADGAVGGPDGGGPDGGGPDGGGPTEVRASLHLRYPGEGTELTVALDGPYLDEVGADRAAAAFRQRHVAEYGHGEGDRVEVVRVEVQVRRPAAGRRAVVTSSVDVPAGERRRCRFDDGVHDVAVRVRTALGTPEPGPLLVDEADTTTVVPPGWWVHTDLAGNLVLEDRR